ncbi:MAG TPA: hypothetical protein VFK97_01480 [Candidatus Saccharimonadales bacterium]|nr:hypothetical protein [Candidatus Saccharimonadales bacterium]
MSEYGTTDLTEIDEILTPQTAEAQAIRGYVETLTEDDYGLSLEATPPSELERLQMRFIGWRHTRDYVPSLFKQIEAYDPQILILEGIGGAEASIKNRDQIQSLYIFGVPVAYRRNGELYEPVYGEEHQHEMLLGLIRSSDKAFPIIRKMDATEEQERAYGLSEERPRPHQLMWDDLDWHLRPMPKLRNDFAKAFAEHGRRVRVREAIMTGDVSRISANALAKLRGDVRVMICFGHNHTPVARHFQRLGVNADLRFIDTETHELTTSVVFSRFSQAEREANFRGSSSPELVSHFMLRSLLIQKSPRDLLDGEGLQAREQLRQLEEVADRLIAEQGPQIWEAWEKLSRHFMTRGVKETAALAFKDMLGQLILNALDQTEGQADSQQAAQRG